MAISADVLDALIKAGCTAKQLAAAVRADELASAEKLAKKREQNRIRVQNHRARNARNALHDVTDRYTPAPPYGSSPETLPPSSPPSHSPPKGGSYALPPKAEKTPRQELQAVLDVDHAGAVVDHRQRLRKPLTAHAARLLAGKLARWPDPNAAADAMVANGWQGFEPEWMENRSGQRATGPPQGDSMLDAAKRMMAKLEENGHDGPTIEASDFAGKDDGTGQAFFRLAPPQRQT